jgi:hypothetical protein
MNLVEFWLWLVNTFVGDLKQNQLIGHIQEMASFIAFSLIHLLVFFVDQKDELVQLFGLWKVSNWSL